MPPSLKPPTAPSLKPTTAAHSLKPATLAPDLKRATPSLKPMTRPRILLIDDDHSLMERTAVYLRAKGFLVTSSENVFSVASTVGSEKPDAIVLDVRMPALGGDKVASVLSRLCSIPIVFYSAIDEEDGEALAAGHENARFVSKGAGLRCLWERLVEITGSSRPAVGL
jgi:two-component system, OmpR family, KDP operon response regulator KdpE